MSQSTPSDSPQSQTFSTLDLDTPMQLTRADFGAKIVTLFEDAPLELECGTLLFRVQVAYHDYGRPSESAFLVCHALTGSSAAHLWWWELFEVGSLLDPQEGYTVCSSVLGSCVGTSGALEFGNLPVTISDMVRVQKELLEHLGVRKVSVLGGSMGGMQVLEWVRTYPELLEKAAIIAAPQKQTVWSRGFNVVARALITEDPAWNGGHYLEQPRGLALARMLGMLTYRSPESLEAEQSGPSKVNQNQSAIESYLEYQAKKLLERFDAQCYLLLMNAMDAFDVPDAALEHNTVPVLVVGISSDVRYPAFSCRELAEKLPHSEYWEMVSPYGHDAFLVEMNALERRMRAFFRGWA